MELSEVSPENVCRLCSWKTSPLLPLLASSEEASMIRAVLPVKVESNDPYPKYICKTCLYKLNLFHEFYLNCQRNEERLKQWYHQFHRPGNIKKTQAEATERDPIAVDVPEEPCTSSSFLLPQTPPIVRTTENEVDQTVDQSRIRFAKVHNKSMLQNGEEVVESELGDTDAAIAGTSRNIDQQKGTSVTYAQEEEMILVCSRCGQKFSTKSLLIQHVCNPARLKRVTCCYCDRIFLDENSLSLHKRSHIDPDTHSCSMCKKEFETAQALGIHSRECMALICTVHNDRNYIGGGSTQQNRKDLFCNKCSKYFRSKQSLTTHLKCKSHRIRTLELGFTPDFLDVNHEMNDKTEHTQRPRHAYSERHETSEMRDAFREMGRSLGSLEVYCDVCNRYFINKAALGLHKVRSKTHKSLTFKSKAHKTNLKLGLNRKCPPGNH